MQGTMRIKGKKLLAALAGTLLAVPYSVAQPPPTSVPPGTPVNISVVPGTAAAPPLSIILGPRHGHVTPVRHGCTHTGGGNIDVSQPSPDTLVITMSGAAVAYGALRDALASQTFYLEQCFEVSFDNPKIKKGKLTMEGRVVGLLRSHCPGDSAAYNDACAAVGTDTTRILQVCVPPHSVGGNQNLSVNDHDGPCGVPVVAGKYLLRQTFHVSATAHACVLPLKGPSAEFAPDPAIDPLWLSYKEPFHGAVKKDFGFQVTIKVAEDSETSSEESKEKEKEPEIIPVEPKKVNNGKP